MYIFLSLKKNWKPNVCLLGAFVICWTPGLVVLLLDGLNCEKCNVLKFKRWLLLLAVLNSVINPIIYSYRDEEMWTTIKNLMRCICSGTRRQRSSRANIQRSSGRETNSSLKENTAEDSKVSAQEILTSWRWAGLVFDSVRAIFIILTCYCFWILLQSALRDEKLE